MKNELRAQKSLLAEMVRTDFKLRYQGSILGYLWSLMKPLMLFVILYFVFTSVFRVGDSIPNYPVYLLFGIVIWSFFTEATTRSLSVMVDRGDLIRKISLPRHLLVVAINLSALINFLLNMVIVSGFIYFSDVEISLSLLLGVFVLLELIIFTLFVSLFLAAVYVKVRDISYIWEVFLQGAFYATPILYPLSLIPEKYTQVVFLNPMAQIIQDARWAVLGGNAQTAWGVSSWAGWGGLLILASIVLLGWRVFNRNQKTFAEDI